MGHREVRAKSLWRWVNGGKKLDPGIGAPEPMHLTARPPRLQGEGNVPARAAVRRCKHTFSNSRMGGNIFIMVFVMKTYLRLSQEHPLPSTTEQLGRTLKVRKSSPQQTVSHRGAPDGNVLVHVSSHSAKTRPFEFIGAQCPISHSGPVPLAPSKTDMSGLPPAPLCTLSLLGKSPVIYGKYRDHGLRHGPKITLSIWLRNGYMNEPHSPPTSSGKIPPVLKINIPKMKKTQLLKLLCWRHRQF